jgi:hypothetical protein
MFLMTFVLFASLKYNWKVSFRNISDYFIFLTMYYQTEMSQ